MVSNKYRKAYIISTYRLLYLLTQCANHILLKVLNYSNCSSIIYCGHSERALSMGIRRGGEGIFVAHGISVWWSKEGLVPKSWQHQSSVGWSSDGRCSQYDDDVDTAVVVGR